MFRHLNYSHLYYFGTVAREGSIARAADVLHLTLATTASQFICYANVEGFSRHIS